MPGTFGPHNMDTRNEKPQGRRIKTARCPAARHLQPRLLISTTPSPAARPNSRKCRRWKKAKVALRRGASGKAPTSAGFADRTEWENLHNVGAVETVGEATPATPPPTSPPCAASPSTSCARTTPPQKASTENASAPPSFQLSSLPSSNFDASALKRDAVSFRIESISGFNSRDCRAASG